MITAKYVRTFAKYNQWQNTNVLEAGNSLTDEQRKTNIGAFFGSIQGTLSHLLWGDSIWLDRLMQMPYQSSPIEESGSVWLDWEEYKMTRKALDQRFIGWSEGVADNWLQKKLTYTNSRGIEVTKPIDLLAVHIFNHQTHHRGQVHCLLTHFGVTTKDTDFLVFPECID